MDTMASYAFTLNRMGRIFPRKRQTLQQLPTIFATPERRPMRTSQAGESHG